MASKPVQVSLDDEILKAMDADPEARSQGRSAFVRAAVRHYLRAKKRCDVDLALQQAFAGQAEDMLAETDDLPELQLWPEG